MYILNTVDNWGKMQEGLHAQRNSDLPPVYVGLASAHANRFKMHA